MRYFRGHRAFVQSLAFSPDGQHLASAGGDGAIRLWDVATARLLHTFSTAADWACAVAFSADGSRVLGGSYDGTVRVWDTLSHDPAAPGAWSGQGRITAVAWSANDRYLAWSSYDRTAVCDLAQDPPLARAFDSDAGRTYILTLSPDSRRVATAGSWPEVVIRDLESRQVVARLRHGDREGCWGLAYFPRGHWLAVALAGGLEIWDVESGRLTARLTDHGDIVAGVAFSPDGRRLLTCSWDQTARLYEFDPGAGRPGRLLGCYDWEIGKLFDVALSPDGMLAATGGDRGDFLVAWDVE